MVSDQFLIFLDFLVSSMEKKNVMSLGKSSHIFIIIQTRNDKLRQTKEYEVLFHFKFKLLFFCFIQFLLPIIAFLRDMLHFLLISFELTIQDRSVLLKPKLWHTVMTSYHYPHSGLTRKSRCAFLGFQLCSKPM